MKPAKVVKLRTNKPQKRKRWNWIIDTQPLNVIYESSFWLCGSLEKKNYLGDYYDI